MLILDEFSPATATKCCASARRRGSWTRMARRNPRQGGLGTILKRLKRHRCFGILSVGDTHIDYVDRYYFSYDVFDNTSVK